MALFFIHSEVAVRTATATKPPSTLVRQTTVSNHFVAYKTLDHILTVRGHAEQYIGTLSSLILQVA
jgi:hypothetical protein